MFLRIFKNLFHLLPKINHQCLNLDCPNGKFGLNCAHNCSEHCLVGEHCNKKDGTCQGCSAGWETKFCNKSMN